MFNLQNSLVVYFFLFLFVHKVDTVATTSWNSGKRWGEKLLNLKILVALFPKLQTPPVLMSNLVSFVMFAVLLSNSSPVIGVNFGSISMSLQTCDNIFALRSLRSLYLIDTKPPFLQVIQFCILNLLPQGYVVSKFAMLHSYRKGIAPQGCYFDSSKKYHLSAVLIDYFLIDLDWCGVDLAFLFLQLV